MQFIKVNHGQLSFAETSIPEIRSDECLIKVRAIGINRADLLQRQGMYPAPKGESEILGLEASGEIVSAGCEVQGWKVGQRVFGLVAGGAYAEYVAIKARLIMALPSDMTFEQGAATAEVFLTAYQSLFLLGKLEPQQNVLIHAGASGVGTAAIQLAKAQNCFVAATVSSLAKSEACALLGADLSLIYKEMDFQQVLKERGLTFDVIIDVVAANYINKNISLCALDGKIIILSMLGGRFAEQVDIGKMLLKRAQLIASTLRNRSNEYKVILVKRFTEQFGEAFKKGEIKPIIDSVYDWHEVEIAHQKMLDNNNVGKIVLSTNVD